MGTSINSTAAYLADSIVAKISLASSSPEAAGAVRFASRGRDQRRTGRISRGILSPLFCLEKTVNFGESSLRAGGSPSFASRRLSDGVIQRQKTIH